MSKTFFQISNYQKHGQTFRTVDGRPNLVKLVKRRGKRGSRRLDYLKERVHYAGIKRVDIIFMRRKRWIENYTCRRRILSRQSDPKRLVARPPTSVRLVTGP